MVYLDAASAEPLHPAARNALLTALDEGWADPARRYAAGRRSRLRLDAARAALAESVGVRADELSFPASGTAAVQLGLLGAAAARQRVGSHLVVSAVEHSAVLHAAEAHPGEVTVVPVNRLGRIDPDEFAAALRPDTALACLQTANHEVGTEQPVPAVAAACQAAGVPLLVDAAQSVGRVPVPDGWSVLAASAHKWGGPPGVGVLVVRKGTRWRSVLPADERERGRVAGFENVPAIVAAAVALAARLEVAPAEAERQRTLVDRIRARVPQLIPDVEVVGDPVHRLPHLVTFSCLYLDGETLVSELDRAGFAVNSGSSCTSSTLRPSHVLEAMGVLTHGNVRVSLPLGTGEPEVERFLEVVPGVVAQLRAKAGVSGL
ncbi:MAG: aminotransferase class V-fold PLP-dependent enzyme [Sporichthyaceae bacterium]|nr:aminotransferase class V-fold PLP-dependent enzyme [Sporichthyaceae bacterium]